MRLARLQTLAVAYRGSAFGDKGQCDQPIGGGLNGGLSVGGGAEAHGVGTLTGVLALGASRRSCPSSTGATGK